MGITTSSFAVSEIVDIKVPKGGRGDSKTNVRSLANNKRRQQLFIFYYGGLSASGAAEDIFLARGEAHCKLFAHGHGAAFLFVIILSFFSGLLPLAF